MELQVDGRTTPRPIHSRHSDMYAGGEGADDEAEEVDDVRVEVDPNVFGIGLPIPSSPTQEMCGGDSAS